MRWWASFFHDTVSRLTQIQAPTLVIHGELDAMSRQHGVGVSPAATSPLVTYISPYLQELPSFFSLDAASLQSSDSTGHVGRIILPISVSDLAGVLNAQETAVLQKLPGSFDTVGQNAYPAAGQVATDAPFSGGYPRLQPDPPYAGH